MIILAFFVGAIVGALGMAVFAAAGMSSRAEAAYQAGNRHHTERDEP